MTWSQVSRHDAERVDWALPGATLAALDTGPGPDHAVVLVPGYTGSKEDFVPMLGPLARTNWRAVAVDLPGQYESEGSDDEAAYAPERLSLPVAGLVAELRRAHRHVVLLGHSFGGLVARAAVLSGAEITGLTLLCSGPARLPVGDRHERLDLAEQLLRSDGIEAVQTMRDLLEPVPEPAELALLMRNRFLRSSAAGLLGMAAVLRTEPDRTAELADALDASGAGRLVVCGAGDDAWPIEVQRDMAERLRSPFELVPGATHTPNTENPPALLEILHRHWDTWVSGG